MPQYSYPVSDIDSSNWVAPPLWSNIDEDPASDSDIIQSTSTDIFEYDCTVGMQNLLDPGYNTGHEVHVRACRFSTTSIDLKVELLQSAVVIATWTIDTLNDMGSFSNFVLSLTSGEVASLVTTSGSYQNLSIRLTAINPTLGLPDNVQVSRLRIMSPDAGFTHVDMSSAGLINVGIASGNYLERSGGGLKRVAGVEGVTALVINSGGLKVHG